MAGEDWIMHVDMDAFFAAVEQAAQPGWRGRPVIVGGPGRSVVASASYEARKEGIHAGQPVAEALRLCPGAIVVPGHHPKYLWLSTRMLAVLRGFSPVVEAYSIDEAFLDMRSPAGGPGALEAVARRIQERIAAELRVTCSIGAAPNKLLAKVASDQGKPAGVTVVPAGAALAWLHRLPVGALPGVGKKTGTFLADQRILTVADLAAAGEATLFRWFGQNGRLLYRMAQGRDDSPVLRELPALQSIGQEWTLPADAADRTRLDGILWWLAGLVGRRVRAEGRGGRTVTVKIRRSDFSTFTRAETVTEHLWLDEEIGTVARRIFGRVWRGEPIRLLGVSLSHLSPGWSGPEQLPLWPELTAKKRNLAATVDRLRDKYGEDVVMKGTVWSIRKGRTPR